MAGNLSSFDPDAFADAGLRADQLTDLAQPLAWHGDDAGPRLARSDPAQLIGSWQTVIDESPGGIRLAVSGVELADASPTLARLRKATGVASAFLADEGLCPFPLSDDRLRIGVLPGSSMIGSLTGVPAELRVLTDAAGACDVLVLDDYRDLDRAGAFSARILLTLAPGGLPGAAVLRTIGAAAELMSAGMWAIGDAGLDEAVRSLVDAAAHHQPLDVAIRQFAIIVAHPEALLTEPPPEPDAADPAREGRPLPSDGSESSPVIDDEPRYLAVQVYDSAGIRRRRAFRRGARHEISVRIGPHDDTWLDSGPIEEQPLDWDEHGATVRVFLTVNLTTGVLATEPRTLVLPRQGASRELSFAFDVPAAQDTLRLSVHVYQQNRVVQVLDLVGPVADEDVTVGGARLSAVRSLLRPMPAGTGARQPFDASLGFYAGGDGEAVIVGADRPARLDTVELAELQRNLTDILRRAVGEDGAVNARPGSAQQTAMLRDLARFGIAFYQELVRQGFAHLSGAVFVQVVTSEKDGAWPIEMVYDRGVPDAHARLCRRWRQALDTGRCDCPEAPGTKARRVICPLGFWGIRMVIERRMLAGAGATRGTAVFQTDPLPGRRSLREIDAMVFAAKHGPVSAADRGRIRDAYRRRLGLRVDEATSWRQWRRLVDSHGPPLLVLLSHNTEGREQNTRVLQIGQKSEVLIDVVGTEYVVPPRQDAGVPGPVVVLLGCNTAISDTPWQDPVSRFRYGSAAVVIGTVVETLGGQAAEAACEIAVAIAGGPRRFGDLMRAARRALLAKGLAIAFSVVAFGDADWDVPARSGT
ncbi:hypothetical protein [Actinoplanes sp. L3-i22]|uniref:hypothetical protein n=1 Tax=Actinoplanes sp. L3-i22 TaxID=2836373 RepID=UPI001C75CCDB|nr:hypothetical protein [Actinoplanes sp. L3-i22]BCY10797.1 hypothetical protein L3i22_058850 [Actinoplanes sp. L3-i22]